MKNRNEALAAEKKHLTLLEDAAEYLEHFDILETITNVGNDEVFTPRKTCEMLLDALPEDIWKHSEYKWLNPATKNGVFEREIALRLDEGLKDEIPDEETRRKHILQNMIFAIGQTRFTASVARRTLYYCCEANRKCDGKKINGHYENGYAIGKGTWFDTEEGNILTPNTDHTYVGKEKEEKCKYCGISKKSIYNSEDQIEKYAYEFIHFDKDKILEHLQDRFFKGDRNMKFDVIIGNPPYQMSDGGAAASAMPIYQKFVKQAIELGAKYISMIMPSRWMLCGKGLDDFREFMINNESFRKLSDFLDPKECFPHNDIKGGVCFFLYDRDYIGQTDITVHTANGETKSLRYLKEDDMDIYVRYSELITIMQKVQGNSSVMLDTIVSPSKPYGFRGETMVSAKKYGLPEFCDKEIGGGYKIFGLGEKKERMWKYLPQDYPFPKKSPCIDKYKVFIAKAYGCGAIGEVPSTPVLSTPGEVCTETFIEIGPFETAIEAANVIKYIKTKFFRALVGIQKQTQDATRKVYRFVPIQDFTPNSDIDWNDNINGLDSQLFKKYNLNKEEIDFIKKNISEMKE